MRLRLWFGLVIWLAVVFALLKVTNAAKLSLFDPEQTLVMKSLEAEFEPQLTKTLKTVSPNLANRVFHIRADDCICETLAENHSQELSQSLANLGFQNELIDLKLMPQLAEFVPATPAVAVFNDNEQLLYLGPYSVGLGCLTNNSLSQQISNLSQVDYLGSQINADVKGCYCHPQLASLNKQNTPSLHLFATIVSG